MYWVSLRLSRQKLLINKITIRGKHFRTDIRQSVASLITFWFLGYYCDILHKFIKYILAIVSDTAISHKVQDEQLGIEVFELCKDVLIDKQLFNWEACVLEVNVEGWLLDDVKYHWLILYNLSNYWECRKHVNDGMMYKMRKVSGEWANVQSKMRKEGRR
jgi:hypothetical protein